MVRREVSRVTIDASQTLGGSLKPSHRPDRNPVDIERLTPERHRFFDYDYDNDKDCVRCSTSAAFIFVHSRTDAVFLG